MAASDALPVPRKNVAWRMYFALRKNDGTLITSWSGADTEISKDGGSFADCTNEATEIGTSGCGYIDLTSSEMNADNVIIKTTVTNTNALPLVTVVFPEEAGDYRADVTHFGGAAGAFSGGRPEVNATHWGGTAVASAAVRANAIQFAGQAITCAAGVTVYAHVGTAAADTAQTGDAFARLGSDGAGLTAIPWNAAWDAEVQSECADALTVYDPPTKSEMDAGLASVAGYLDTEIAAILEDTGTTLPAQIAALSIPSAATNASAVRTELATELARIDVATSTRLASGSYTAPLDAAGIRTAIGLGSANLDTQLSTIDSVVDAILADTGTDGVVLSSATRDAIAASLLDLAAGVQTDWTLRQALRIILATAAGKISGAATTTITIRDVGDAKDRIVATVDGDGNRSAITYDKT